MELLIRSGQQSDVSACVDIMRAWVEETPWAYEPDEHHELVAIWSGFFKHDLAWVAQSKGRVVGFCSRGDDNINALYVASDMRNAGVGKRLLDEAKMGRDWITVWAYAKNVRARDFYRREGLVEVSREVEEGSNLIDVEHRWNRST